MSSVAEISLKPTPADVSHFNAWFDRKCAESGIEGTLCADLKLCLNEALVNLISYGFEKTPDPWIRVEIALEPGTAAAVVTDNGRYFDIRFWPVPKDRDLMTAEPGGYGIGLIRERATRIAYTHEGEINRLSILCAKP